MCSMWSTAKFNRAEPENFLKQSEIVSAAILLDSLPEKTGSRLQ